MLLRGPVYKQEMLHMEELINFVWLTVDQGGRFFRRTCLAWPCVFSFLGLLHNNKFSVYKITLVHSIY